MTPNPTLPTDWRPDRLQVIESGSDLPDIWIGRHAKLIYSRPATKGAVWHGHPDVASADKDAAERAGWTA